MSRPLDLVINKTNKSLLCCQVIQLLVILKVVVYQYQA